MQEIVVLFTNLLNKMMDMEARLSAQLDEKDKQIAELENELSKITS